MTADADLLAVHALGATRHGEAGSIDASIDAEDVQVLERYDRIVAALDRMLELEAPPPRRHVWVNILGSLG